MSIDNYRSLVALRHSAEAIDEVNVFLARALETDLRLREDSAWEQIKRNALGGSAFLLGAFAIGGDFLAPGVVLGFYLLLSAVSTCSEAKAIRSRREELTLEKGSVQDYLRKVARDRLANGVTIAIQNRRGARRELPGSTDEDRQYLEDSIEHWGTRLRDLQSRINSQEEIWKADPEKRIKVEGWIAGELGS